jgi:hypothetical protein
VEKTRAILKLDATPEEGRKAHVNNVIDNSAKNVTKKKNKNEVNGKPTNVDIITIVTENSRKYDLNYFKQFNRQLEYCDRDPFRIHDPLRKKSDHGSKDRGLVYVEFNAGLFQAMKSNMMKPAKEKYNISLTMDPKLFFFLICPELEEYI